MSLQQNNGTQPLVNMKGTRSLSLPKQVEKAGGIAAWNDRTPETAAQWRLCERMCTASTVEEAIVELDGILVTSEERAQAGMFVTLENSQTVFKWLDIDRKVHGVKLFGGLQTPIQADNSVDWAMIASEGRYIPT